MEFEITARIKAVVVSEAKGAWELRDRNRPEVGFRRTDAVIERGM
jgi:hypothetical protein